jgi:hypothetical protein
MAKFDRYPLWLTAIAAALSATVHPTVQLADSALLPSGRNRQGR